MLKKIVAVLVVVLLGLVGFIASRPDTFEVKRSLEMKAPPEVIYAQVSDFHAWAAWSPWEKIDADLKKTFDGPASGVGAFYAWEGEKTGAGNMKITEAKPGESLGLDLNFMKPFEAHNRTEFTFMKHGEGTVVTWSMKGTNSFGSKAAGVFMNMDKMVGGDFEKGLAAMATASEQAASAAAAAAKKAADDAAAAAAAAPTENAGDAGTP